MQRQPTLASSCARAATAAEARFRISYPEFARRNSRVIALDGAAAEVVRQMSGQRWDGGHFLVFDAALPVDGSGTVPAEARLRRADGTEVLLSEELHGADTVVMVAKAQASPGQATTAQASPGQATPGQVSAAQASPGQASPGQVSAEAAAVIGDACALRSIMSAGLVIPGTEPPDAVVSALRPNAMVLVVLRDGDDIPEILSALRV
jgi:hypothetical protein